VEHLDMFSVDALLILHHEELCIVHGVPTVVTDAKASRRCSRHEKVPVLPKPGLICSSETSWRRPVRPRQHALFVEQPEKLAASLEEGEAVAIVRDVNVVE
jgi:hypothetical protein